MQTDEFHGSTRRKSYYLWLGELKFGFDRAILLCYSIGMSNCCKITVFHIWMNIFLFNANRVLAARLAS